MGNRHHGRPHVKLQQIGHCEHLGHVRNQECRFSVRIEHDLRISDVRILRLHRSTLQQVVGDQSRCYRNVHRVAGMRQDRFIIAIDKVPHHEVPH